MAFDPITFTLIFTICLAIAFFVGLYMGRHSKSIEQPDTIINLSIPADSEKVTQMTRLDPGYLATEGRAKLWWAVYDRTFTYNDQDDAVEAANDAVDAAFGRLSQ